MTPYKSFTIPNPYGATMYGVKLGKGDGPVVGIVKHNDNKWDGYFRCKPVAVGCSRWSEAAEAVIAAHNEDKASRSVSYGKAAA